jgi:hypothetical protein
MKATLKFKLPQDYEEYRMAVDGSTIHHVLYALNQWLRGKIKYPEDDVSEDTYNAYQEVRNKINELTIENNIEL